MYNGFAGKLYDALQGDELTVEQIADVLWGSVRPKSYRTSVRVCIHALRRELARDNKQRVEAVRALKSKGEPGRYRLVDAEAMAG